jgi:hypothetical protein
MLSDIEAVIPRMKLAGTPLVQKTVFPSQGTALPEITGRFVFPDPPAFNPVKSVAVGFTGLR